MKSKNTVMRMVCIVVERNFLSPIVSYTYFSVYIYACNFILLPNLKMTVERSKRCLLIALIFITK